MWKIDKNAPSKVQKIFSWRKKAMMNECKEWEKGKTTEKIYEKRKHEKTKETERDDRNRIGFRKDKEGLLGLRIKKKPTFWCRLCQKTSANSGRMLPTFNFFFSLYGK
jgi:hypothetical protein